MDCSFIHSDHFNSASSSPLLLRGALDAARILCRSFTPKRHRQLWVKNLPKVPVWRLERESNPWPIGRKASSLPMHHTLIVLLIISSNSGVQSESTSNSTKTQLIWFGIPQQLLKLDYALLSCSYPHFTFLSSVHDLGIILDSTLSFSQHITSLTRSSYFRLRCLRAIRKSVSIPIFTYIVPAFICSRINYCNSLLVDLHKSLY